MAVDAAIRVNGKVLFDEAEKRLAHHCHDFGYDQTAECKTVLQGRAGEFEKASCTFLGNIVSGTVVEP